MLVWLMSRSSQYSRLGGALFLLPDSLYIYICIERLVPIAQSIPLLVIQIFEGIDW